MRKSLYNSITGRTARPRKTERRIGEMPKSLMHELSKLDSSEVLLLKINASLGLMNQGIYTSLNRAI